MSYLSLNCNCNNIVNVGKNFVIHDRPFQYLRCIELTLFYSRVRFDDWKWQLGNVSLQRKPSRKCRKHLEWINIFSVSKYWSQYMFCYSRHGPQVTSSFIRIWNNEDQSYLHYSPPPQHFNPILYPDTSNFLNDFRFMRKSIKIDGLDIVRLLFLTTSSRDFCIFCLSCPIQFFIGRRKET